MPKEICRKRKTRLVQALLLIIGITAFGSGCASNLIGEKLQPDGSSAKTKKNPHGTEGKAVKLSGIPFHMLKPRFEVIPAKIEAVSVTQTSTPNPASQKVTFDVSMIYDQPDPSHRYTLNVDPTLLSNINFETTFHDLGSVSQIDTDVTTRIPEIINALGTFVGNVLGTAIKTVLPIPGAAVEDDETSFVSYIVKDFRDKFTDANAEIYSPAHPGSKPCTKQPTLNLICFRKATDEEKKAWENIVLPRLQHFMSRDEEFLQQYYIRNRFEQDWLATIHKIYQDSIDSEQNKLKQAFKNFEETIKNLQSDPTKQKRAQDYLKQIRQMTTPDSLARLDALKTQYTTEILAANGIANDPAKEIENLSALFDAARAVLDTMKSLKTKAAAGLAKILALSWDDWRWRYLLALDTEIQERTQQLLAGNVTDQAMRRRLQAEIAARQEQQANTLGLHDEFARRQILISFLEKISRTTTRLPNGTVVEEANLSAFKAAQEELTRLEERFANARAALKSKESSNSQTASPLAPALPRCCYFLVTLCLSQGEEIL